MEQESKTKEVIETVLEVGAEVASQNKDQKTSNMIFGILSVLKFLLSKIFK